MACSLAARVFALCRLYDWRFVYCSLPSVYNEFLGLLKLHLGNNLNERIVKPVEATRDFRWVNGIDYCDSKDQERLLNVIELNETKPQDGQAQTTRFCWVTDLELNKGDAREVSQCAGRGSRAASARQKNFAERVREASAQQPAC